MFDIDGGVGRGLVLLIMMVLIAVGFLLWSLYMAIRNVFVREKING